VALRDTAIGDLFAAWTVYWAIVWTGIAMIVAPKDLRGIVRYLVVASALAPLFGAWWAGTMWIIIRIKYGF
jgi:hypothetical protein